MKWYILILSLALAMQIERKFHHVSLKHVRDYGAAMKEPRLAVQGNMRLWIDLANIHRLLYLYELDHKPLGLILMKYEFLLELFATFNISDLGVLGFCGGIMDVEHFRVALRPEMIPVLKELVLVKKAFRPLPEYTLMNYGNSETAIYFLKLGVIPTREDDLRTAIRKHDHMGIRELLMMKPLWIDNPGVLEDAKCFGDVYSLSLLRAAGFNVSDTQRELAAGSIPSRYYVKLGPNGTHAPYGNKHFWIDGPNSMFLYRIFDGSNRFDGIASASHAFVKFLLHYYNFDDPEILEPYREVLRLEHLCACLRVEMIPVIQWMIPVLEASGYLAHLSHKDVCTAPLEVRRLFFDRDLASEQIRKALGLLRNNGQFSYYCTEFSPINIREVRRFAKTTGLINHPDIIRESISLIQQGKHIDELIEVHLSSPRKALFVNAICSERLLGTILCKCAPEKRLGILKCLLEAGVDPLPLCHSCFYKPPSGLAASTHMITPETVGGANLLVAHGARNVVPVFPEGLYLKMRDAFVLFLLGSTDGRSLLSCLPADLLNTIFYIYTTVLSR